MPAPSVDVATLAIWLTDARAAYQSLMTGKAVVKIIADGFETQFRYADANKLQAYIAKLESDLAAAALGAAPSKGAIGFVF